MRFEVDSYFAIGKRHSEQCMPCQDYSLAVASSDYAYAIVSDGCSTGNKTDVGSRLTTLVVSKIIHEITGKVNWQQIMDWHFDFLHTHLKIPQHILNLTEMDMLATCVSAIATVDNELYMQILGDGVIGVVYRDGTMRLDRIEWSDNIPFYPIYRSDMNRFNANHQNNAMPIMKCSVLINGDNVETFDSTYSIDLMQELPSDYGPLDAIEYIGVFSDGVCQLVGYNWIEATKALLKFPTSKGAFFKRRLSSIIRQLQKEGKGPIDDIAGAVLHIIHEDEQA
jgi:hypothetical protein